MRMTVASYNNMNSLANMCFECNAIVDNLAYSLEYHFYNEIANIIHKNVAHVMPMWADLITDQMLILGGRPVREPLNGYDHDYTDINEVFQSLYNTLMSLRHKCSDMIGQADIDGDDEVRMFGEDFMQNYISKFIKQSEEWINAARIMGADKLNIHIKQYTHFIEI